MKKVNIVPNKENKEWRFRWYHVLICSVLIAAVLISMSVGLGYAKFVTITDPLTLSFEIAGRQLKFPGYIIAKRVAGEDTVLVSEDGKFKVTVPATADGLDGVEYLLLKNPTITENFNQYDKENQQNSISCSSLLRYYSADVDVDDVENFPFINDSSNSIVVELTVGHDAVEFINFTPDTAATTYDGENGILTFTGIGSITDQNGTFAAEFDRAQITPDTSWYDEQHNAFIIHTAAQLAGVAQLVNHDGKDFSGKTIVLDDDISLYNQDNSKYTWEPIGNDATPFKGSFDGKGHTISGLNLRVYDDSVEEYNRTCGLFGEIAGDGTNTIKNVNLTDVSYAADMGVHDHDDDGQAFGPLAGFVHGVKISNVHVDGLKVYGTARYIGGIIGRGDSNGTVSLCSVENAEFNPTGADYVGGIVGLQLGNMTDINISMCYVSADITGSFTGIGGIVGNAYDRNGAHINDAVGLQLSYAIGNYTPTTANGIVGTDISDNYTISNSFAQFDDGTWQTEEVCWFSADMTYDDYLNALRANGINPEIDVYDSEQYETPIL